MSQTATLQALDATMLGAFAGAGMADAIAYTPPGGGAAVPCTATLDRAAQFFNEQSGVAGTRVVVTLQRAEVDAPARGGTVVIGAETFLLGELLERDESLTRWVVVNG
jgi:hypothetical protein